MYTANKIKRKSFANRLLTVVATSAIFALMVSQGVGALTESVDTTTGESYEPHLIIGKEAAVAIELKDCAEAGTNILKKGGTAVDAAIASTLCISVVHTYGINIGGGGHMLIRSPNGTYEQIDFKESAPAQANGTMFLSNPYAAQQGGLAVAVPGVIRGLELAHQRHGKLPWKDLFETAIHLTGDGFQMTDYLYTQLKIHEPIVHNSPELSKWYAPKGKLIRPGQIIRNTALAKTLKAVADKGANEFYEGETAKALVNAIQKHGGIITLEDMKNYTAIVRPALTSSYHGYKVTTTNAPTSGPVLLAILNLIEPYHFNLTGRTAETMHRLMEAFKFGYSFRTELSDPGFDHSLADRIKQVISKEWANEKRKKITDDTTHDVTYYEPKYVSVPDKGTMHLSIVDKYGGVVSLTGSVNSEFGARFADPVTGVVLNNQMDDFSTPGLENHFGFTPSPKNSIAPGKRPLSTMSPTIIEDEHGIIRLVVGGAGGSRILSAVVNVIVNTLDFGMNVFEAIKAPRLHHQLLPHAVEYEGAYNQSILNDLRSRNHLIKLNDESKNTAGVHAISKFSNGTIHAASDPRRGGLADAY